jgi:pilus assembly protein CpaE
MTNKDLLQVEIAVHSEAVAGQFQAVVRKGQGFGLMDAAQGQWPDLLILELSAAPEGDFARVEALLGEGRVKEIFVCAVSSDPALLMRAMRAGVKEYFPLPLNLAEARQALDRFRERTQKTSAAQQAPRQGRVISVGGSKGGVGTTTVAVNLAIACAESARTPSVALLDMNTLFGEIPLFLEISPKFHWGEITKNINRLDDAFLMNVLTRHGSGVHVLPSPAYLNGHHSPTPDMMQRLLEVMRRVFDVVVIDAGQSMSDASLKGLQLSDHVLLVSILSLPCLSNTSKLLRSYADLGYVKKERLKVVLNRYMKRSEISLADAEAGIGQPVFWTIPNDYKTSMAAINSGKPLSHVAPRSEIARSFAEMTESLMPSAEKESRKRWSLFKR